MTVYLDKKNGTWKAEVWRDNKKYKTKGGFRTKALAERFERETLNEIDRIRATGIEYKEKTYNELFDLWYANASIRKRSSSLIKDVQMHEQYVSKQIGNKLLNEIVSFDFDAIITGARKRNLKDSSINKIIQHFKSVFSYAQRASLIPHNPSSIVSQIRVQDEEMLFFTQTELNAFMTHSNAKYTGDRRIIHVLHLFLFSTGVRLGEALGMTWKRIDFDGNRIIVADSWNISKRILEVNSTKGKKARIIPLPHSLKLELLRFPRIDNLIFGDGNGVAICASNLRKHYWNGDIKKLGLKRIRIHDARHTYGAHFMMNGGDLYKLQKILGHQSITTTQKYAHLAPEYLDEVRDMVKIDMEIGADVKVIHPQSTIRGKKSDEINDENVG